jgi:hypothetical protein
MYNRRYGFNIEEVILLSIEIVFRQMRFEKNSGYLDPEIEPPSSIAVPPSKFVPSWQRQSLTGVIGLLSEWTIGAVGYLYLWRDSVNFEAL